MNKKFAILMLMLATLVLGVPSDGYSSVTRENNTASGGNTDPQITFRIGQPRRRGWRHRRYRRIDPYPDVRYRRYERTRLVPEYYWMNGRRYVRYVRVRY